MTLTIFTPTYNRAHLLPKLYESLCEQTSHDFLWLLVDDGSTDNTQELLRIWQKENRFPIRCHRQKNGGKMRAHNRAVEMCETELFMCVDSDDQMASRTAVEDIVTFWKSEQKRGYKNQLCYEEIGGIISYKEIERNYSSFPENVYSSTINGIYELGFRGDTTLTFRTAVLREFPFPEIEGENFITEAVAYDRIDIKYQMLLFPYPTQKCRYRTDGYTLNEESFQWNNPKGYRLYYNQCLQLGIKNVRVMIRNYIVYSLIAGDRHTIRRSNRPLLTLLLFPYGYYAYLKKKRGRRHK